MLRMGKMSHVVRPKSQRERREKQQQRKFCTAFIYNVMYSEIRHVATFFFSICEKYMFVFRTTEFVDPLLPYDNKLARNTNTRQGKKKKPNLRYIFDTHLNT